jgi:capsular exopolysaccharide synthesis family protein
LVSQQTVFRQNMSQLQLDQSLKTGGASRVSTADVPLVPFAPTPRQDATKALFIGLILAVALVILLEYVDDRLKTKADVERVVAPLPVLGMIPGTRSRRRRAGGSVDSVEAPRSPAAEAYRSLRTSIQFLALDKPVRIIQVTSPSAEEGKTTTIANLGVAIARTGRTVAMVCCDLRRPSLHTMFGMDNRIGFTSVVVGEVELSAAVQAVPGQPRVSVIASGPLPPNPSELLASDRASAVIAAIGSRFDVVLVDCPPLLPVTDAVVLSAYADVTIVIAAARRTTRKQLHRALEILNRVNAPVAGIVLNRVVSEESYGYGADYSEALDESRGLTNSPPRAARSAAPVRN